MCFIACCLAFGGMAQAQPGPQPEDQGTYLGVLFSKVPVALYDQLPQIPRDQGVLVTHILPDSPAAKADLRRHDILLQYGQEKIRDCEDLVRMIQADKPERKLKLLLLRAGKEMTVEVTLGLGPMLKIAKTGPDAPRGVAKPGGSAPISISALPLDEGKMKVVIEYYVEGTGRLRTLRCEGLPADIDGQVQKELPEREVKLVQYALQRIRNYSKAPQDVKTPTPER
jgi:membrane-associated protease RseP (regulator of RpoE activity)